MEKNWKNGNSTGKNTVKKQGGFVGLQVQRMISMFFVGNFEG